MSYNYICQDFNYKYTKKYIKKRRKSGIDAISTNVDDHDLAVTIASYLCLDTWGTPELSALTAHVCEKHTSLAEHPERTNQICQYSIGLHDASISNFGLSHAKVREYWLYRGPRQFTALLMFLAGTLLISETLKDLTRNDRIALLLTSTVSMGISIGILYYLLPDGIRSGISRSTHDYYVKSKKKLCISLELKNV
jgi:hypothetical protein